MSRTGAKKQPSSSTARSSKKDAAVQSQVAPKRKSTLQAKNNDSVKRAVSRGRDDEKRWKLDQSLSVLNKRISTAQKQPPKPTNKVNAASMDSTIRSLQALSQQD